MKKALRDLSRHWRKKVLHAQLTIKHPTGDMSHGDKVWGCSRTCCPSTILFLEQHPRGASPQTLPCSSPSSLHPRNNVSTTAAPSELGHLTILPDHFEPKPQGLESSELPQASPGQASQLEELSENPVHICKKLGSWNVDVQQIKSCVNKIL